jgi:hypothetical protein
MGNTSRGNRRTILRANHLSKVEEAAQVGERGALSKKVTCSRLQMT